MAYIDDIHVFIKSQAKKARNLYFSPETIDAAINRASMDEFKKCFGLPEDYAPGRPVPRISYEITAENVDAMRVFKVQSILTPSSGQVTIPTDYVHISMIGYQPSDASLPLVEIKPIDDARWISRLNRKTTPPSVKYPVCNIQSATIKVAPTTLANVHITYLRLPVKVRWGYTIISNSPVYALTSGVTGNTIDIDWPEIKHNDIIASVCRILGVPLEDMILLKYSEQRKDKGQ